MTIQKYLDIAEQFPGAVLVGGTVRNHLLGLSTAKSDIDLLVTDCDLSLEQYWSMVMSPGTTMLKQKGQTGRFKLPDGQVVDLTVTSDTYHQNMRARDFSINAFSYSAVDAKVTNWCGGFSDIMRREIRTCDFSEQTLLADPARIIRAVRFKAQLSEATGETWRYCENLWQCFAHKTDTLCHALAKCDQSRIRNEMTWMLKMAPADVMYNELSQLPRQLVKCMLKTAGGELSLTG